MIRIDRRQLIATSAFGLGGLVLPGGMATAQVLGGARGFTHNVASGEPASDSVLLWARYVGGGASARVTVEVAETPDFTRLVAGGEMITGPWRDWTAKITVTGLAAGRRYHYRFIDPDGAKSPVGRTKTLPVGATPRFGIGVFSCANLPMGAFNAYAHAAARDDIDLVMHLGDYFYEYKRGVYPPDGPRWDAIMPLTETIALADYRLRFASYRADPDLQAIHNRHPMIASMDDHESTNDSWEGGAQNHQPEEGDWTMRKLAALQAYREWMPVGDAPYASYDIGDLATLFRTETRLLARTKEPDPASAFATGNVAAALAAFKTTVLADPAATMMGTTQENWLARGLRSSTAAKRRWQVVGTGTIMGQTFTPPESMDWIAPDAAEFVRRRVQAGIAMARAGIPNNLDAWGGYPKARARLLGAAQRAGGNLVMLAGDSHNAWAYELANDGRRAGVEFAGQAVTSPGYESFAKVPPATVAAGLLKASPELKWCDTSRRGYMALMLTPQAATNEWVFMQTIASRTNATQPSHRMRVRVGTAALETV